MSDTSAKIRSKGLEHTGVTEEHATQMYNHVGSHYVGVVDLKVVRRAEDDDGKRIVELVIDTIEIAPNDDTAEHIRELTRAFHTNRKLAVNGGDQLPIEGTDEPTVEQVRAAGRRFEGDSEAEERALAEQEAADEQPAADSADTEDPWDEGPPTATIASPFEIPADDPDLEPEPAA